MAFSAGMYLTNAGRLVLAASQTGAELHFTRLEMGDGQLAGQLEVERIALISPKQNLELTVLRINTDGTAMVGATFQGSTVGSFLWRELGLWVRDPNNPAVEILYGYANAGSGAQAIPEAGGAEIVEKTISVVIAIGNASNITATVASGLYADAVTLNAHINDYDNPHNTQLSDLGGAPLNSPGLTGTPTAPTPLASDNSTRLATTAFVRAAVTALVNGSPAVLDTLQELAAALGNDPNFATTMVTLLAGKAAVTVEVTGTLTAAGWSGSAAPYTQSISMSGVTAAAKGIVGVARTATAAQRDAARAAMMHLTAQTTNSITITADGDKPSVDIPIVLEILG